VSEETTPNRRRLIIGILVLIIMGVPGLCALYALVTYSFVGIPLALFSAFLLGDLKGCVEEVIIRG
jgi:hypothetical protein